MRETTVDYVLLYREDPPLLERALYLMIHDQQILNADPNYTLMNALVINRWCRLRAVKLLDRESVRTFQCLPAVALNRFFELLDATPETAGKQNSTRLLILSISSLHMLVLPNSRMPFCNSCSINISIASSFAILRLLLLLLQVCHMMQMCLYGVHGIASYTLQ